MVSIVDVISQNANLTMLNKMVNLSNFAKVISNEKPMTFFAPDDNAFNATNISSIIQNTEEVERILKNHLFKGALTVQSLRNEQLIKSVGEGYYTVVLEDGNFLIEWKAPTLKVSKVLLTIETTDGPLHIVGNVFN